MTQHLESRFVRAVRIAGWWGVSLSLVSLFFLLGSLISLLFGDFSTFFQSLITGLVLALSILVLIRYRR